MHTVSSQFYKTGQKSMIATDFATNPSFGPQSQYFKTMSLGMHAPSLELKCNLSQSQGDDLSYQEMQNKKFPETPIAVRNIQQFLYMKQAVRYLYKVWAANKKIIKKKQSKVNEAIRKVQTKQFSIENQKKIIVRKIETAKRLRQKNNKRQLKAIWEMTNNVLRVENQLRSVKKLMKMKQKANAEKQLYLNMYAHQFRNMYPFPQQTHYSSTHPVNAPTTPSAYDSNHNNFQMQFANEILSAFPNYSSGNSGKPIDSLVTMKQIHLIERGSIHSIGSDKVLNRKTSSKSWIPDGQDSEVVDMIRQSVASRLGGTNKTKKSKNPIIQLSEKQDSSHSKMKTLHQSSINIDTKTDNVQSISSPKRNASDKLQQLKTPNKQQNHRRSFNHNRSNQQQSAPFKQALSQVRKITDQQENTSRPSSRVLNLPNVLENGDLHISQAESRQHNESNIQINVKSEIDSGRKQSAVRNKSQLRLKNIENQARDIKSSCINIVLDSLDMDEFEPKSNLKKDSKKKQPLSKINEDEKGSSQLSPSNKKQQPKKVQFILNNQNEENEDDFDDLVLIQESKIGKREKLIATQNINSPQSPIGKRKTTRSDGNASQPSARDSIKTSQIQQKNAEEDDDDFFNDISLNRVSRIGEDPEKVFQTHRQSDQLKFSQTDISKIRNSKSAVIATSNPQKQDAELDEIRVSTGSKFIKKGSGIKSSMLKSSKRPISAIRQCDEQQQTQSRSLLPPKPKK